MMGPKREPIDKSETTQEPSSGVIGMGELGPRRTGRAGDDHPAQATDATSDEVAVVDLGERE